MEVAGIAIDTAGVLAIILGIVILSSIYLRRLTRGEPRLPSFIAYRHGVGRAILLGLELLVAADIIRTVAVEPTFQNVGVLAAIVLIRTFLSVTLELEITGRWPWEPRRDAEG